MAIADAPMAEVRAAAAQDGRTVRSLVEQGLRKLLAERAEAPPVTTLRDATFTGNGMNQEFVNAPSDAFAELIYELPRLNEPRGVDHRQRSHRTEDPRRADRGALCLDHGVDELWSSDRDFARFPAPRVAIHW